MRAIVLQAAGSVRGRLAGIAAAAGLALAAGWIAGGLGDPLARNPVLVSMLFGLLLSGVLECPASLRPGLDFTKRHLLRLGVMLLGFRITTALLADLGWVPIAIAATELVVVLVTVRWAAVRVFRLDPDLGLLVGVGAAVCGAAAILSVASLARGREKHAGVAITLITLGGTVALLLYPVAFLGGWMPGLDERGFAITVGASIFELAQVYGASFAVSEGALNIATLVKLSKVVMLIPLLLVLGTWRSRAADAGPRGRIPVPWFVIGFVAVMLFNSSVTLHPQVRQAILEGDQFLFLMVTVSLGLTTSLGQLRSATGAMRLIGTAVVALVVSAATACALTSASGQIGGASPRFAFSSKAETASLGNGARLFEAVGCAKCHVPSMPGARGGVWLYSDLLLHDMGAELDDKIVQGDATGTDWRTTPLIGLGAHTRFLHDGRAATLRDAVLAHGGEGAVVRGRFFELDASEQAAVFAYLSAL